MLERSPLRGAHGGLQALLVPRRAHFDVVVDTEPRGGWAQVGDDLRADLDRHRLRFRAAHEIGHSFFYERAAGGIVRRVPDSDEQERFCDAYARALLVPPNVAAALSPTPGSVLELQLRYDVSVELAARALGDAHPEAPIWLLVEPDDGPVFVQWRSPASYAVEGGASAVLRALDRFADLTPAWLLARLPRRRQVLAVFSPF